mgnify:FL=1
MSAVQEAAEAAALKTARRLGYVGPGAQHIIETAVWTNETGARQAWGVLFPHDPDSFAVIMADAREARAAAERRAAL